MSTLDILQDILIDEFDLTRAQLSPQAELVSLGVDSLDLLELMFKIEDRCKLAIRDDVPTDLSTVQNVVDYIDGLIALRQKALDSDRPTPRAAT